MKKINKSEMLKKYGIDLSNGIYAIEQKDDKYIIYKIKDDTHGCLLVGENSAKGKVLNSKETFKRLMEQLRISNQKWWEIEIL